MIISLLIFFSTLFTCYAFDFAKTEIDFQKVSCDSNALEIFWEWLLSYVKLTPAHAALHDVFKKDSLAVFVDLDDDGVDEILATHLASVKHSDADCLLYILKWQNNKYIKISSQMFFDLKQPVIVLKHKTAQYRDIQVFSQNKHKQQIWIYDLGTKLYRIKR